MAGAGVVDVDAEQLADQLQPVGDGVPMDAEAMGRLGGSARIDHLDEGRQQLLASGLENGPEDVEDVRTQGVGIGRQGRQKADLGVVVQRVLGFEALANAKCVAGQLSRRSDVFEAVRERSDAEGDRALQAGLGGALQRVRISAGIDEREPAARLVRGHVRACGSPRGGKAAMVG